MSCLRHKVSYIMNYTTIELIFTIDKSPVSSSTPGNKYVGQVVHETKCHSNAPSEETAIPDKSNITSQPSSSQTTGSILTPELSIFISDDQTMEGNINVYINLFLVNMIDSAQAISSVRDRLTRPPTNNTTAFVKTSSTSNVYSHSQSTLTPSLTAPSEESQQTQGTLHY